MSALDGLLADGDLLFLVETVLPERNDQEHIVSIIRDDADFVEAMLGHEKVSQRLLNDEEILLKVSPQLFFAALLQKARRDLRAGSYTVERRQGQTVAVFDSRQAADLLDERPVRNYLAAMLASFSQVRSATRRVRVRQGVWRRQHFNDLDIDGLIRNCNAVDERERFRFYKRIADVCLFLAGMFPESIEAERHGPNRSPLARGNTCHSIEDYEREGQTFYSLAARHEGVRASKLADALAALAANFTLAEKPLTFISNHYLQLRKHNLFEM